MFYISVDRPTYALRLKYAAMLDVALLLAKPARVSAFLVGGLSAGHGVLSGKEAFRKTITIH
jgi:hypothetical protein